TLRDAQNEALRTVDDLRRQIDESNRALSEANTRAATADTEHAAAIRNLQNALSQSQLAAQQTDQLSKALAIDIANRDAVSYIFLSFLCCLYKFKSLKIVIK